MKELGIVDIREIIKSWNIPTWSYYLKPPEEKDYWICPKCGCKPIKIKKGE